MKIILDVMGGDNAPRATVEGAVLAAKEYNENMVLVGKENVIKSILKELNEENNDKISIVNAEEEISMEDDASAVRTKKDSSMARAIELVAQGEGDAVVSAGNTGAFLTGTTLFIKRIKGIRRAALTPILPTANGGAVLIDCGANAECTPEYLVQFAYMGAIYAEKHVGFKNPRVAIINNGAEETKGTQLYIDTHKALKEAKERGEINFIGNAEGRDVPLGCCDVIVCDGFTGNVLLKTVEGVAMFFSKEIKSMFTKNLKTKMAALMMKDQINMFKKKMDYTEVGGAPLLGISKPCVKAHGSSNAKAFKSAIGQVIAYAHSGVIEEIELKLGREKN